MSGYTDCACRDCFEITISDDMSEPELCWECKAAGCDHEGESECKRVDAYGGCESPDEGDYTTSDRVHGNPILLTSLGGL